MIASRLRSPIGIALLFATNGAVFSSVLPWYPTFREQWALDDAIFGLIVASFAAGSVISTVLPSLAVNRFGPRAVVVAGTLMLALLVAAVGWSTGGLMLAILLLAVGLFDAIVDVSQNVAAVRVQDRLKISVMSSMHAFWSVGAVLGGGIATAAATNGVDIRIHLASVAVVVMAVVALGTWLAGPIGPGRDNSSTGDGETADKSPKKMGRLRSSKMWLIALPVAVVASSGTIIEDVANNWAAVASVELVGSPVATAGVAFTVVLAAQTIGRFSGDLMINRFGRVEVTKLGGVLIALGGMGVITSQSAWWLYLGLALVGFGCATLVPSAFVAAARLPGLSEGAGVTLISLLMRVGFLATSPVIGVISSATDLRWALALLIPVGILVIFSARALSPPAQLK